MEEDGVFQVNVGLQAEELPKMLPRDPSDIPVRQGTEVQGPMTTDIPIVIARPGKPFLVARRLPDDLSVHQVWKMLELFVAIVSGQNVDVERFLEENDLAECFTEEIAGDVRRQFEEIDTN